MKINTTEVNQRLIQNEVYCHQHLAKPIRQILSITPEQLSIKNVSAIPNIWLVNGDPIVGDLVGFSGIIDLETTGLEYDSKIICAVGIGFIGDEFVCVSIGNCDRLPIQHSTVFNINQPFDRSFYLIENGVDTCQHVDLSSMAKMVHGTPIHSKYGFNGYVSMNGLSEFYFWESVDKSDRESLISGNLSFEDTVSYCLRDVITTVRLAQKIIPDYVEKNPSPISLFGLSRRSFSIPISPKLQGFYSRVEAWYQNQLKQLQVELEKAAINALHDQELAYFFSEYPESFATQKNLCKAISGVDSELATLLREQSKDNPRARNKCIVKICKGEASFSSSWVAMIVKARYRGEILKYSRQAKVWMYGKEILKNIENPDAGLLTPFSKGYFKDDQLTSDISEVRNILKSIQHWISFSSRIEEIKVDEYGYHHPRYTPQHTLTGRSVDKVFLLCPKPKEYKGGSEFLRFIEAKPGYKIVTADFDSAELLYGSHVANYYLGVDNQLGCEFAKAILEGDSSLKTDIHSVVAEFLDIGRGESKNLNYGANYGQGVKARIEMLMRVTGKSYDECVKIAEEYKQFYIEGKADPFFAGIKEIARFNLPTSLLMSDLPNGLLKSKERDFYTTKNNRVIQALGTDHLNLLITDVERNVIDQDLDARLILTRHDECLFEVLESHVDQFSQLLQDSHRFTVECILARLGIYDAVEKWLYFSSVDVMDRYCDDLEKYPITCTELLTL